MPSHEHKQCQRCGDGFECKTGNVLHCQCQSVVLTSKQRDYIARKYDDCLCALCLMALQAEFSITEHKLKLVKLCCS